MSRIAGLQSGTVRSMLLEQDDGYMLVAGQIGWTGTTTPGLAEAGDVACALDGTIYSNTSGRVDAEHVLSLYLKHGFEGTLRSLNGDFAIAIDDRRSGTLWLGRDRFGVRPLYHLPDGSAFASRLRPLLLLPGVDRKPLRSYVGRIAGSHYRTFDNDPTASPFASIAQLPAAHLLEVTRDGAERRRWWGLEEQPDLAGSEEELAARYRELLLDSVGIRLARAQNPAFTLSGGMDSSSVIASAVRLSGSKQHAFSSTYSGSEYDESHEIASMLDTAVEKWHRVQVDNPDVVAQVGAMVDAHDEPVATATWLAHHVLAERVADAGFDVLFGGLGGDELNAGEYEYFLFRFADLRAGGREGELQHEVEEWVRHHDHPIFRKSWDAMEEGLARLTDSTPGRIKTDRARLERWSSAVRPDYYDLRNWHQQLDHPFTSYMKNRTYQDIYRETAPCCLRAEDRQTRAFGLSNCDPFFDHRLVELMFRVPGEYKIRDGITKRLLREATKDLLPEETRTRIKKTGWNAPADLWFSGKGRDLIHDMVKSQDFRAREVYDVDEVLRLADEHDEIVRSGRPEENHMMFLWQLVNLELWLRWVHELP